MRRRGLTLPEVLVVTGLLAMISSMLYWIYVVGLDAESRSSATGGAYRQAALTLEQIRRELRGARLVTPLQGETLPRASFLPPDRGQGQVAVDARGRPTWGPEADITVAPGGSVLCRGRVLGRLGAQGAISFRRVTPSLLEISVRAQATDRRAEGRHELAYRMVLLNQE